MALNVYVHKHSAHSMLAEPSLYVLQDPEVATIKISELKSMIVSGERVFH